jgi:hypothetical protein
MTAAKNSVCSVAVAGDEGGRNGRQGESSQEDAVGGGARTCPACVDELARLTASGIDLPLTIRLPRPRLFIGWAVLPSRPPSPLSFSNASAGLRPGGVCMHERLAPSLSMRAAGGDGETRDTQLSRTRASPSAPLGGLQYHKVHKR